MADIGEEGCEQRANRKDPEGLAFSRKDHLKALPGTQQTVNHSIIPFNCSTLNC